MSLIISRTDDEYLMIELPELGGTRFCHNASVSMQRLVEVNLVLHEEGKMVGCNCKIGIQNGGASIFNSPM